jgi:hypothetical protein
MPIPTIETLRRASRRLQRTSLSLDAALKRMRGGELLLLDYSGNSTSWSLAGMPVTADVARLLIQHARVRARGDCLFGLSQSYQWQD